MPEAAECALFAKDITKFLEKESRLKDINANLENSRGEKFNIFQWSYVRHHPFHYILGDTQPAFKIASYGKILEVRIGEEVYHVRLGMTGRFSEIPGPTMRNHTMVVFEFLDGKTLCYIDPRRFSTWKKAEQKPENWILSWDGIGQNPHIGNLHGIIDRLGKSYSRKPRITWLLATGPETGIGNYLANEALGRLDLNPYEIGDPSELYNLLLMAFEIASDSFAKGGNSFGGGYYRFDGKPGGYADDCKFYQNMELVRSVFRGRPVYSRFAAPI